MAAPKMRAISWKPCNHQVEAAFGKAVEADAINRAYPVEDERRNGNPREVAVEPVVVVLLEYILHQAASHRYCHKAHHQPGHAALGQVPFQDYSDKIGIEDDGIDDDGRRKNEVQDELQHPGRLVHLVFALSNQRAAHLRGNEEPHELPHVNVEIIGLVDAKDVEEGSEDSQKGCRDDACDDKSEEQLRHHVQGMGGKTAVVHALDAHQQPKP